MLLPASPQRVTDSMQRRRRTRHLLDRAAHLARRNGTAEPVTLSFDAAAGLEIRKPTTVSTSEPQANARPGKGRHADLPTVDRERVERIVQQMRVL